MTAPTTLDRTYHFVLATFVARGRAPDHAEIARHLGVAPEEGRKVLRELMGLGLAAWFRPGTDLIASFAPFNDVPTPYRLTVDGRADWFGQCGFEALAAAWLFPGRTVQIDAPCPHCGEPLHVEVRDGVIERAEPDGIVCYVDLPFREWPKSWAYT